MRLKSQGDGESCRAAVKVAGRRLKHAKRAGKMPAARLKHAKRAVKVAEPRGTDEQSESRDKLA